MSELGGPVLAVCGKGGVGKTSISAMLVRHFAENSDSRVLAVDADPAAGLAAALGIEVSRTVDEIRNDLIRQLKSGRSGGKEQVLAMLDYEMFAALQERKNIAFLAIGRPEKEGCYCQVNHILKDVIASVALNFDYVIIDGEAGIEQVNRRVMEEITHLLLVSDASVKGIRVVDTIGRVAGKCIGCAKSFLIFNRIRNEDEYARLAAPHGIRSMGWLPEEEQIRAADIEGRSLLDLPECRLSKALGDLVEALEIDKTTVSS